MGSKDRCQDYENKTEKVFRQIIGGTTMNRKEKRDMIAHKIAWQHTKCYDPLLSKESWCEIAAREAIDWADEHPNPQPKKEWLERQSKHKDYYTKQELIDMGFIFTLNGDIVTPDNMMEDMKKYLAWHEKKREKKPVWTDNDRTMVFTLRRDVDQITYISEEGKNKRLDWLNSLEDRFNKGK